MIKRRILWVIIVLVITAIVIVQLLYRPKAKVATQPKPATNAVQLLNSDTRVAASNFSASQPQIVDSKNASMPPDIEAKYRQGLISKDEAMSETYKRSFNQPQSFYGKVIDQNGQPIAGVEATGTVEILSASDNEPEKLAYTTQSDSQGLFQFVAEKGWPFNVTIKREGYLMGERGEGYQGPPGEKTTPYNRAILTMWKLHGAEPLVGSSLDAIIPFDGTPTRFDIATGKQSENGDLQVALTRSPLEVRRGRDKFDWIIKIGVVSGEIIAENDAYPYWAPKSGYESSFEFNVSSNDIPWHSTLSQNFYIKNAQGRYGRMQAEIYTALTPARVQFNFTINPSGSQNLEPTIEK